MRLTIFILSICCFECKSYYTEISSLMFYLILTGLKSLVNDRLSDIQLNIYCSGCEYKGEVIKEDETINIGCQHCRCVRSGNQHDLECSSCDRKLF